MANLARFTVNLVGSNPPGIDLAPSAAASFKLEAPSGVVQRWTLQVFGPANPDAPAASKNAPLLTLVGATSGERVDAVTVTSAITTALPSTRAHSWKVRSLVNGGLDANGRPNPDYVFERIISIRTSDGRRKVVDGEGSTYEQAGVARAQNELVDLTSGLPSTAGVPDGYVLSLVGGVPMWVPSAAPPVSPLTIMAGHIRFGYSGDVGLTGATWQDQGPSARHLAGTCSVLSAAFGGKNVAQFDGSTQKLEATFAIPAPGTSPSHMWVIARNDFDAGFEAICVLQVNNGIALLKDYPAQVCTVTPGFGIRHANGFTVGAWKRARAGFTNSASDYAQVGSGTAVTGAPAANTAGDGIHLGYANGTYSRITLAEVWVFDQDPGPTNLAALDAWASTKYGTAFP